MSIWEHANPRRFTAFAERWTPPLAWVAGLATVAGLGWGFLASPPAEGFGATVKIIYLHVPAAMIAINAWLMMLIASLFWLIRRHHVSALAAKAAAPIGVTMTLVALFTGAVWGQPTWGTWWVWDPRLTSFLILFLFYLGYIALWEAIEDPDTAADLTSVLCMVGSVFAILSRYAVNFWNQGLHQGASIFRAGAVTGADTAEKVSNVYFVPLMISMAGFVLMFVALVLWRTRTEIALRRLHARALRERMA